MIDTWFKKDLQAILESHSVVVFIDESGDAEFLLGTIEPGITTYRANSELEELHTKYLIERKQPTNEKFVVYTRTKKEELKFLREYCETSGCVEIRYFQNYIKDKVHQTLNLNINLSKDELIAAGKVSVGKDSTYWMDLSHKGSSEIFDLNKELLPFVHDPAKFSKEKYDAQLRETFYRKVNDLLGQDYFTKPAQTLADEIVKRILDTLAMGQANKVLDTVYRNWIDSVTFKGSFTSYLSKYDISAIPDIWKCSVDHPFRQVDEKWLAVIGTEISNKAAIQNFLLKIKERKESRQAKALGICFWTDVIELLEFDAKDISYLSSFNECVDFYKRHFCKLDTAIRNLYAEFLNKGELLAPYQELYKEHVAIFLDKWFHYWSDYKETQTGTLQRIIMESSGKTAVIVGDGVAYEMAEAVAERVGDQFKLKKDSIIADLPSETENNMSRIYMDNGLVEAVQSNREKYLVAQNPNLSIDFLRLDEVCEEAKASQFLICTYKDIDDMGEKLQQKALKYFPETIDFFARKIELLLCTGYEKVYLITDHGFVLTGLLSESDKISATPKGMFDKAERYIRTQDKQADWFQTQIELEKTYKDFRYLYVSRNMNPFKTPGLYGFSHGGACPQELVTPCFCWEKSANGLSTLSVVIENKTDLATITGELFSVRIGCTSGATDLFSLSRKIYLVFFAKQKLINKSEVFKIEHGNTITKEYSFDGNEEIEVQILDAITKQQLDRVSVKRNKERDLGGLL